MLPSPRRRRRNASRSRTDRSACLAEEVERVFPDWVERDADGYRFVTERGTTALMTEALCDPRTEKDEQIAALRREVEELRRLIQAQTAKTVNADVGP